MNKIMIIETGQLPDQLIETHNDYSTMFRALLNKGQFEFHDNYLVRGDALPTVDDADGFLITGSRHGVYDQLPWIEPLKELIRQIAAARKPLVGICFGHQIMAEALGGKAVKSSKGWGLGHQSYDVIPQIDLPEMPSELRIHAVHQDQVVNKPPDARVFAQSDFCEFAGLVYGNETPYAISLQPHPEFSNDFVSDLIKIRKGGSFPIDQSNQALMGLDAKNNRNHWGDWIADFYRQTLAKKTEDPD